MLIRDLAPGTDLLRLQSAEPARFPLLLESVAGGNALSRWDLLLLGDLEYRSDRLTLPHAEVTTRRFVLVPLLELDPALRLPDGTVLREALERLEGQRVVRYGAL